MDYIKVWCESWSCTCEKLGLLGTLYMWYCALFHTFCL